VLLSVSQERTEKSDTHQKVTMLAAMKITYSELPPTRSAVEMQCAIGILEGRWKMMILAHLFGSPLMRFSDLQRAIPAISQKMLIQQLRALEQEQVIFRTIHAQVPPRVEYGLTEIGRALGPVFKALLGWADLRRAVKAADQVSNKRESAAAAGSGVFLQNEIGR
jgi:DNA-binding HxlR family transcriptional regulator